MLFYRPGHWSSESKQIIQVAPAITGTLTPYFSDLKHCYLFPSTGDSQNEICRPELEGPRKGGGLVTGSPGLLNLFCMLLCTLHHLFQWLRDFVLQVNTVVWDERNRKNKPQFIAPWAEVTWAEFSSVFTTVLQESTNHRASKNSLSSQREKKGGIPHEWLESEGCCISPKDKFPGS